MEKALKIMQRYKSNNGYPANLGANKHKKFWPKNQLFFCNTNNIKFFFAPLDDHRPIGVVEVLLQTPQRRLAVIRIDGKTLHTTIDNKSFPVRSPYGPKAKHTTIRHNHNELTN